MKGGMPGKAMSNTQVMTSHGKPHCGVVNQGGSMGRGARMDPPKGASQPAQGKASKQTRNSPSNRA